MLSAQSMTQDARGELPEGKLSPGPFGAPDPTADAVSSLRALALSTMRLKRRKDAMQNHQIAGPSRPYPIPPRPPVPAGDVDILDYGSEDQPSAPQSAAKTAPTEPLDPLPTVTTTQTNTDNGDAREEGEISDEEEDTIAPSTATQSNSFDEDKSSHSTPQSSLLSRVPPSLVPEINERQNAVPQSSVTWNNWVPQPDQVRPGLKSVLST